MAWVVSPLFKKDTTWVSLHLESDDLNDRKRQVYGNIADLDFDYAMGRLSESDFQNIRKSFLAEAGRVMEQVERRKTSDIVERIQKDANLVAKATTDQFLQPEQTAETSVKCPHCGTRNPAAAHFCMSCGGTLHD